MAADVFLCFECGARNRVAERSRRESAKCGRCGAALFPGGSSAGGGKTQPPRRKEGASKSQPSPQSPNPKKPGYGAGVAVISILGIGLVLFLIGKSEVGEGTVTAGLDTSGISKPPITPSPSREVERVDIPPLQARPSPGIYTNDSGRVGEAPFEIRTSPGADYYIKLVDVVTQRDAVGIYVHGGQRLEVSVPLGVYEMRYASGETWRGLKHLFGPGEMTSYSKSNDIFEFKVGGGFVNGFTVELIRQQGGNMQTYDISPDRF